jgi:hypothetical protein
MLAIRGNLTQKNPQRVFIQFSPLAGPTITIDPFIGFGPNSIDLFYNDAVLTADNRWQFKTGVEIRIKYFRPEFLFQPYPDDIPGYWEHGWKSFIFTDGFLQKFSFPGNFFEEVDISRNFVDYVDVSGATRLRTFRAASNQLTSQNLVGDTSLGFEGDIISPPYIHPNGKVIRQLENLDLSGNQLTQVPYLSADNHYVFIEYNISNNLISGPIKFTTNVNGSTTRRVDVSFNNLSSIDFGGLVDGEKIYRPVELDCSFNPNLTSIDQNIQNGLWEYMESLKCNNCQISSLSFPAPQDNPYEIKYLDVSYNALQTINLDDLKNLRYLYANNNALTSLTPPAAWTLSTSGSFEEVLVNGNLVKIYLNNHRLTECDISTNQFTSNPFSQASGAAWWRANGLRYLNISYNPLDVLGTPNFLQGSDRGRISPVAFDSMTKTFGMGNIPFKVQAGDIVVFTQGISFIMGGYSNIPNTPYIVSTPESQWTSNSSTTRFGIADTISAIPTDLKSYYERVPARSISYIEYTTPGPNASGTAYHYSGRLDSSTPFLSKLICTNCPNLTRVSLLGLTGLDYCDVSENPNLQQVMAGLEASDSEPPLTDGRPAWRGGPVWIRTFIANNCPSYDRDTVGSFSGQIRGLVTFSGKKVGLWNQLSLKNCSISHLFLNLSSYSRSGFDFSINKFNSDQLAGILALLGTRSNFTPQPTDSNIVDISNNPGPYSGQAYAFYKNQATTRGWQIKES